MKRIQWLAILALCAGQALAELPTRTVRIATGEWLPYVSSHYEHNGAMARIISEAFALSGIQVVYGYFPWTRGYQLMLDGEWDATMPYYCSPEREAVAYCSDPLANGEQVFFHLKSFPFNWETIDDLKDIPIGATLGYYYGEAFEAAEKNGKITVRRVAKDETNIQLLIVGRIRLFPQDREVGYGIIRSTLPPEQQKLITHHPLPIHTRSLHLIFPRNRPESQRLLELFNAGLKKLREQGLVQRYLDDMHQGVYEKRPYHAAAVSRQNR